MSETDADHLEDEGVTIEWWTRGTVDQAFVIETVVLPVTHRVIGPQDPPRFKLTTDERDLHHQVNHYGTHSSWAGSRPSSTFLDELKGQIVTLVLRENPELD